MGVDRDDLNGILNFMYNGEVNISQESLQKFLTVAEELEVKGNFFLNKNLHFLF